MLVTPSGIGMSVSPWHPENAYEPMLVKPLPSVKSVMPEQQKKAHSPKLVTLSGIAAFFRRLQFAKALSPMTVKPLPSVKSVIPEQK